MRKFVLITLVLLVMGSLAIAQEVPKVEVFGGYSLFHVDSQDLQSFVGPGVTINQTFHGWNGALQYNVNKTFGIVADFSGHYGTPVEVNGVGDLKGSIHNFLFGPSINFRGDKAKGFVHALFGVNRFKTDANAALLVPEFTDNAFAMALGGGVDYNVTKRFGIRLGQFDYVYTNHDTGLGHQNNYRFSTGILINLGGK